MQQTKQKVKGFGGSEDEEEADDNFFNVKNRAQIMTIAAPRKASHKYDISNFDYDKWERDLKL